MRQLGNGNDAKTPILMTSGVWVALALDEVRLSLQYWASVIFGLWRLPAFGLLLAVWVAGSTSAGVLLAQHAPRILHALATRLETRAPDQTHHFRIKA